MNLINTLVFFVGFFTSTCMGIEVVGTTGAGSSYSASHTISIDAHPNTKPGDLLVLVAQVTEGLLPENIPGGWEQRASCFKKNNGAECKTFGEDYKKSYDLGQAIYTKRAGSEKSFRFTFDKSLAKPNRPKSHKTLLSLATVRGADTSNPIREWKGEGADRTASSRFPSIDVQKGDMVLLSQVYDDGKGSKKPVRESDFKAPNHFERVGIYLYSDEANFLYARVWPTSGATGKMTTTGGTGSANKDNLISLAVKPGVGPPRGSCNFPVKSGHTCSDNGCKALVRVRNFGTCKRFCEAYGLECVAAWDDGHYNDCRDKSKESCDTNWNHWGTSDAICQCAPN